jgi:hypothetical protein
MLHRYWFKNFFSFRDETEVTFVLGKQAPEDHRSFTCETNQRLNKALAVIGHNASGKTNLIKPLVFINWFVKASFQSEPNAKIPLEPHFFSDNPISEFTVEFDWDGTLWRYSVALAPERVLSESLYRKTSRLFSYVFEREWQSEHKSYVIKQQGFGLPKREAEKVRENVSLISWAAQFDIPLVSRILADIAIYSNVNFAGRSHLNIEQVLSASEFYARRPQLRERMVLLLKDWDLGLNDVEIRKVQITKQPGETDEIDWPFGIHRTAECRAELSLLQESSGTQSAFVLLSRLLPALEKGGLAVIDEMEADLHPHMLTPIMELFFNEKTNPNNAQIIFTCHSMEILNLLHKAQVVLVEKNEHCESEAWRLDEMQGVRADDNLYAKYMAGTYGDVPSI